MKIASLALALLTVACSAAQVAADPHVGQTLPIHVQDMVTAQPLDSASWQGHVVLVDLWASWCESCKAAMPHHVRLWQQWHARGFDVVAISVDEEQSAAQRFLRDMPLPFVVAWDAGQRTVTALAPAEMPTAYVLDRQGRVLAVASGGTAGALRIIDAAVAAAFGSDPTPTAQ